jgi:hypothetical protein
MDRLAPAQTVVAPVKTCFQNKSRAVPRAETAPRAAPLTPSQEDRLYQHEVDHVVRFFALPPEELAHMFKFRGDLGVNVNARKLGARADEFQAQLQALGYVVTRKQGSMMRVTLPR